MLVLGKLKNTYTHTHTDTGLFCQVKKPFFTYTHTNTVTGFGQVMKLNTHTH